jgi:hypothetical protein
MQARPDASVDGHRIVTDDAEVDLAVLRLDHDRHGHESRAPGCRKNLSRVFSFDFRNTILLPSHGNAQIARGGGLRLSIGTSSNISNC